MTTIDLDAARRVLSTTDAADGPRRRETVDLLIKELSAHRATMPAPGTLSDSERLESAVFSTALNLARAAADMRRALRDNADDAARIAACMEAGDGMPMISRNVDLNVIAAKMTEHAMMLRGMGASQDLIDAAWTGDDGPVFTWVGDQHRAREAAKAAAAGNAVVTA